MIIRSVVDANGQLLRTVQAPDQATLDANTPPGATTVAPYLGTADVWWNGSTWVTKPAQPTPYCQWDPVAKAWVDPRPQQQVIDTQWVVVRAQRTALLAKCDWTQVADVPLTQNQKTAWAAYRQALRDIPEQNQDPFNVTWPTPPVA